MIEKIGVVIRKGRCDVEKSVQNDSNNKNLNSTLIAITESQSCYNQELTEPINRGAVFRKKPLRNSSRSV